MTQNVHPMTAHIGRSAGQSKIPVYLPPLYRKPYWRKPVFREGDWYVRDQYMWRKLRLSKDGFNLEGSPN